MKKVILCALAAYFLAAGYAGTGGSGRLASGMGVEAAVKQITSTTAAAKSQAQPASKQSSLALAAQKRLCGGLKRFKGKIQQIERSLSEATMSHNGYKAAASKIKREALIPLAGIKTIAKKAPQEKTVLIPAEKIRGQVQVLQDLKKVHEDVRRIRGSLRQQLAGLQKDWAAIEPDLKQASASSSVPSPERLCASQEAKEVGRELAVMGSQAGNLQSQIDDLRAQLDEGFGQTPCASGPPDCRNTDCCGQQYRITAPEGSLERAIQELERRQCEIAYMSAVSACDFENFDQKTNQLFNILSTIVKNVAEMRGGVARNIL
jgi:chromosome segregation ATPase